MAEAKIEVEVGQFRFSGEGEQGWLAQQMDKILKSAEALTRLAPPVAPPTPNPAGDSGDDSSAADEALPQFLDRANAKKSQVDRFLATAEWLGRRGTKELTTSKVSRALKDAHQSKLSNPSDCLAKNSSKGFCVKDGKNFYVTDDGRKHLGL
jgi:hypothetical protein